MRTASDPHPLLFAAPPTLEQALTAVNNNTGRVQQLKINAARLSVAGAPALTASIALERPRRFRMRAETALTGPELDLGSNEELFWLWAKRNEPAAVLYARHDRYAASSVRRQMPIEPSWLIEALGLVEFDPRLRYEGPFVRAPGKLEVRSFAPSPQGDVLKVTVLNATLGYVEESYIYDARGQPVAVARMSDHKYYAAQGVSLPRKIEVNLPATQMSLRLDLGEHLINQPTYDAGMLYTLPRLDGYPLVDITDPAFAPPLTSNTVPPPAIAPVPSDRQPLHTGQLSGYRGYERR